MGAVVELRDHCQEPLPWALNFGVFISDTKTKQQSAGADAKEVETTTAPTPLVPDPVATAANEGQSAGSDDKQVEVPTTPTSLVPDPVSTAANESRWKEWFGHLQFLTEKIGHRPLIGLVARPGSGLLGKAEDAFQQVEAQLQDAQLDPALGRFNADGFGSQRCAWAVVIEVTGALLSWAEHVYRLRLQQFHQQWVGDPKEQVITVSDRIFLANVIANCPLSTELTGKLSARLDLEQVWLSRRSPADSENEGERPKRGGDNRGSDQVKKLWETFAYMHGLNPDGRTIADKIKSITPVVADELHKLAGVAKGLPTEAIFKGIGGHKEYRRTLETLPENDAKEWLWKIISPNLDLPKSPQRRNVELKNNDRAVEGEPMTEERGVLTILKKAEELGRKMTEAQAKETYRQAMQDS
jgi:hypothetical protein